MILTKDRLKVLYLSFGMFACNSAFAVFREQVFNSDYGGEKFVFPISLTALQFFVIAIVAKGTVLIQDHSENETPQKYYIFVSFFNILALLTTNISLQFIPYVVMVVGKACKPIPVLIFTAILAKKSYTIQRYIFVIFISFGVCLFVYRDGLEISTDMLTGNILILVSLLFEGFLAASQAKMRISSKPSSINYMYYVSIWSSIWMLPLVFINFEGLLFIRFCMRHTKAINYVAATVITGSIGNYFSSAMISNYGPLPTSLVTTTRKFFTVLFSSLFFGNVLNWRQWLATVIIFEALILDVFFGKRKLFDKVEEKCAENSPNNKIENTLEVGNEIRVNIVPESGIINVCQAA